MTASAARRADPLARQRTVILAALLAAAAAAWVGVLSRDHEAGGHAMPGHGEVMPALDLTMGLGPLAYLGMWILMMAAMMFPAAAPMVLTYARWHERRGPGAGRRGATALFLSAYLTVWAAFGALAFGLSALVEDVASGAGERAWGRVAAGVLVAAGAYQLTPVKDRCLAACRSPFALFARWWRPGRWGGVRLGLVHGAYCAGCCWLLFVVLIALGVMSVAVMLAVAAVVFVEKTLPGGHAAARALGPALVAWGLAGLVDPSLVPTAAV